MSEQAYMCHEANGDFARSCDEDLRSFLEHRGLSTEGDKAELVARLRADDRHPNRTCECRCCVKVMGACEDDCADPLPEAERSDPEGEQ
jgi:hypothetical protein